LLDLRTPGAFYDEVYLGLHGAHQGDNAACALAATEAFFAAPVEEQIVRDAMASVKAPGRLEVVRRSPLVVLDGAHNVAGARVLAKSISADFAVDGRIVVVVGLLQGRDPVAMLSALASAGTKVAVVCRAPSPRAMPVADLLAAAGEVGLTTYPADSVKAACDMAIELATESGLVIVSGSLYVVGEARAILLGSKESTTSESSDADSDEDSDADSDSESDPESDPDLDGHVSHR
jgi:dihydrofolate synthase/folylpolyglutamate synthase